MYIVFVKVCEENLTSHRYDWKIEESFNILFNFKYSLLPRQYSTSSSFLNVSCNVKFEMNINLSSITLELLICLTFSMIFVALIGYLKNIGSLSLQMLTQFILHYTEIIVVNITTSMVKKLLESFQTQVYQKF